MDRPSGIGAPQVLGGLAVLLGVALALWCVMAFAVIGKGTPAPLDPPRRLVVRGPYRFVRNPMYIGAGGALLGAAVFFRSGWLAVFAAGFLLATHLFVVSYEEPTLSRLFGREYDEYRAAVRRWWPKLKRYGP